MADMTTFIPIDRATFRRNPNAGRTEAWVSRGRYVEFTRRAGNVVEDLVSVGPVEVGADYIAGLAVVRNRTVADPRHTVVEEGLNGEPVPFRLTVPGDRFTIQNPGELVRWHTPDPDWLFAYVPTPVTCRECGATFLHTELETEDYIDGDGDDQTAYRVCPRCKQPDCCDLAWEKPDTVAREMGLAT